MVKKKLVELSGWGNYPTSRTYVAGIRTQTDAQDVINREVIARGLGRSYADQAINENRTTAVCTHLDKFLSFEDSTGILECEAGVSLEDIINVFAPRKWFPMICPGTKFVTIGGAIANDIHGKAHHSDGTFVNCVISFSILLADGRILNASREENNDLFWANFGGLGLLGIILTAKIQLRKIETTYFKQKAIKVKNLSALLTALDECDKTYNYSVAWIDPAAKSNKLGSGVLTIGNRALYNELPEKLKLNPLKLHLNKKINLPFYLPDFALNNFTSKILNSVIGYMQNSQVEFVHYEKFFFPLDMIGNWNKGYGKRGFIQYQFVIPKDDVKLKEILESIVVSGCTPFLNVFKIMGKAQGILSFPFEGYTLAIDFPMSEKLKKFIPLLDKKVLDAGGRLYLGKDALLNEATFKKMYPQVEKWLRIKSKYDPKNIFTSNISRRLGLNV